MTAEHDATNRPTPEPVRGRSSRPGPIVSPRRLALAPTPAAVPARPGPPARLDPDPAERLLARPDGGGRDDRRFGRHGGAVSDQLLALRQRRGVATAARGRQPASDPAAAAAGAVAAGAAGGLRDAGRRLLDPQPGPDG